MWSLFKRWIGAREPTPERVAAAELRRARQQLLAAQLRLQDAEFGRRLWRQRLIWLLHLAASRNSDGTEIVRESEGDVPVDPSDNV